MPCESALLTFVHLTGKQRYIYQQVWYVPTRYLLLGIYGTCVGSRALGFRVH